MTSTVIWDQTGLDVVDLASSSMLKERPAQPHDAAAEVARIQRVAHVFVEKPEGILQELAQAAVELCGADSAGISLEMPERTAEKFYHWVAAAGAYSPFFDAILPEFPSACGLCLQRGSAQWFRVGKKFFDILGVEAPEVTDGLLLPWQVDGTRGTIFIMAHGRSEAFDDEHVRIMKVLADFAAMGVRQQNQQKRMMEQAASAAAADMANRLAHRINNPLQSLTNVLYLAASGHHGEEAKQVGTQSLADLQRLSALVKDLLALPYR
ncbi:MAG TPA: GAF domain-containing protein [Acidobacteriaceae bacterium]